MVGHGFSRAENHGSEEVEIHIHAKSALVATSRIFGDEECPDPITNR
jgi:hypothetical protein